jgi:hypothetical protein
MRASCKFPFDLARVHYFAITVLQFGDNVVTNVATNVAAAVNETEEQLKKTYFRSACANAIKPSAPQKSQSIDSAIPMSIVFCRL